MAGPGLWIWSVVWAPSIADVVAAASQSSVVRKKAAVVSKGGDGSQKQRGCRDGAIREQAVEFGAKQGGSQRQGR